MDKLVIMLTLAILCQLVFSLHQIAYYKRFMCRLIRKYQGQQGYRLLSEVSKKVFASAVAVIVVDERKRIIEAYCLTGMTIFSRFKPCQSLTGQLLSPRLLSSIADFGKSIRGDAFRKLLAKYQ